MKINVAIPPSDHHHYHHKNGYPIITTIIALFLAWCYSCLMLSLVLTSYDPRYTCSETPEVIQPSTSSTDFHMHHVEYHVPVTQSKPHNVHLAALSQKCRICHKGTGMDHLVQVRRDTIILDFTMGKVFR